MKWYKKTATTGRWTAYVHAVNVDEVRNLHKEDLQLMPDLAARYPGSYTIEEMPEDFIPPEPLQQLVVGNFDAFMASLSFAEAIAPHSWTTGETTLHTPTLTARLQPDGTLYVSGPALQEGIPSEDVQALTRFLLQYVSLPPDSSREELEALEASLHPLRVDLTADPDAGTESEPES